MDVIPEFLLVLLLSSTLEKKGSMNIREKVRDQYNFELLLRFSYLFICAYLKWCPDNVVTLWSYSLILWHQNQGPISVDLLCVSRF